MRDILQEDIKNPITREMLQDVLGKVQHQVPHLWEKLSFVFDADQLQFLDYSSTHCSSEEQLSTVKKWNENCHFNALNVACQTVESAMGFYWKWPLTENELFAFKSGSRAIKMAVQSSSNKLSESLRGSGSILPYWGYGFYRDAAKLVLSSSPILNMPAFTFSKERSIFAQCRDHSGWQFVTMGVCVKPILDFVNMTILSYWDTRGVSGPKRSRRLWSELLPVVLYLMNKIENLGQATLTAPLLFSEASLKSSRSMTASQIQFIFLHEFGHLHLDHIGRKGAGSTDASSLFAMEFEADAYAASVLRGKMLDPVDVDYLHRTEKNEKPAAEASNGISRGEAIHCFFLFLRFLEESKAIILRKVMGKSSIARSSTHPSSDDRLSKFRLIAEAECNLNTEFVKYWRTQLFDATRYASEQGNEELTAAIDFFRLAEDHLSSNDLDRDIALRSINTIQSAIY